jgi:hypothetical protein
MPLKRHIALQQLSREHHHGLLLCWKIKTGFSKNVSAERIKTYADWFYKTHLLPHFELEEKYVFQILGEADIFIQQAIEEHKRLTELFHDIKNLESSLKKIEIELTKHIRFEERTLFKKIQTVASLEQLKAIRRLHLETKFEENNTDVFWL